MLLVAALGVATLLWALRPLPGVSGYNLAVETCIVLLVVWAAWAARPALLRRPAAMVAVAAVGAAAAVRAIGMTMLVTTGIVAVVLDGMRGERPWHRPALWLLFGVGLLTKFAILPLFAAWWLAGASRGGLAPGRRLRTAADAAVPAAIALALCLPFGPASVLRSTVLFNADLGGRAELTTFDPNVISGLATWAGAERLYPALALAGLVAALPSAAGCGRSRRCSSR